MTGLMLHCGGQLATREQVAAVAIPEATKSYVPLSHESFVIRIERELKANGINIKEESLALSNEGQRLFGLMQLEFQDLPSRDYGFVLGLRNSYDRSTSISLMIAAQVFVCDNLSMHNSGGIEFTRKHTGFMVRDLVYALSENIPLLPQRFAAQSNVFDKYRQTEISEKQAHDLVVRLYDAGAVNLTMIPDLLTEWRTPRHSEFAQSGKTAWRLFNAATESMKGDLWRLPARTRKLHEVLDAEIGIQPSETQSVALAA